MRYIKTRPKSQSAFKVVKEIAASVLFFVRDKKKTRPPRQKKSARWSKRVVQSVLCAHRQRECVYMCRVEIILIVFIFLWSLFILFFCLGKKRFDVGVFIYLFRGTKKQSSSSSKKWRPSREKLDSLFFTRFIKPLPPVLVFKKDDDFDDGNALSSV